MTDRAPIIGPYAGSQQITRIDDKAVFVARGPAGSMIASVGGNVVTALGLIVRGLLLIVPHMRSILLQLLVVTLLLRLILSIVLIVLFGGGRVGIGDALIELLGLRLLLRGGVSRVRGLGNRLARQDER